MNAVVAGCAGTADAALLWIVARAVAGRRGIRLGSPPVATIAGAGLAAASIATVTPQPACLLLAAGVAGALIGAVVDSRSGYIFDALTVAIAIGAGTLRIVDRSLGVAATAALMTGAAMLALYACTRGRGLGLGDVKLSAALALCFGMSLSFVALGAAFVSGAAYALTLLARRNARRSDTIRFGPFIATGACVAVAADRLGIFR
jgi:prepilin signal peptidase PulO-like enzyme (type II secretory pathway)